MNRWNIPDWLEHEIIERDRCCIYCGVEFSELAQDFETGRPGSI